MRWAAVALVLAAPQLASGQIADAVRDTGEGAVRFSFDARPDVEICAQGIRVGDHRMWWRSGGWREEARDCARGFVEVELSVRGGRVRAVEIVRSAADGTPAALDVGRVSARASAGYLLGLARRGASASAAEDAILPAMLADAGEVWRDLLDLARDRTVHDDVRERAIFWLGQEAADAATVGISEVALDADEDQEIRDAAVFALSQRGADEAIPTLIEVATTADEAETRRKAMFWLAQIDDPRVVDFFAEVLLGRIR